MSDDDRKLLELKLAAYDHEYASHVRIWGDLERKAEVMTAIAGTFIAAANALAASGLFQGVTPASPIAMVGVGLLGGSAWYAVQALSVREVQIASASAFDRAVEDGRRVQAEFEVVVNTRISHWRAVIANVERANQSKARRLQKAENLLACAIFLFTILTIAQFGALMARPPRGVPNANAISLSETAGVITSRAA